MIRKGSKSQRHSPWTFVLCLLCLALVVVGGAIQVAHSHPGGDVAHADCSLCAAAHVVSQAVAAPAALAAAVAIASLPVISPEPRPSRPVAFALFIRPPPAVSLLA